MLIRNHVVCRVLRLADLNSWARGTTMIGCVLILMKQLLEGIDLKYD
jgi:hypothetical protein